MKLDDFDEKFVHQVRIVGTGKARFKSEIKETPDEIKFYISSKLREFGERLKKKAAKVGHFTATDRGTVEDLIDQELKELTNE